MSSGFITETELEERRKVRQAEWEKVRKPEDPTEAPEEAPIDNRSLYDRLQEQKMKKQEEYEEAHKLKNLVKGLDDDEADFLEFVDKTKMDLERQKKLEETRELNEFRSKMAELREQELNKHIQQELGLVKNEKKSKPYDDELPSIGTRKTTQSKLLAGIVKRKSPASSEAAKEDPTCKKPKIEDIPQQQSKGLGEASSTSSSVVTAKRVLPGLASYSDSSNSEDENSSDSERGSSVPRDLCGRLITQAEEEVSADGKKKK